jgi:hypothetical protein
VRDVRDVRDEFGGSGEWVGEVDEGVEASDAAAADPQTSPGVRADGVDTSWTHLAVIADDNLDDKNVDFVKYLHFLEKNFLSEKGSINFKN